MNLISFLILKYKIKNILNKYYPLHSLPFQKLNQLSHFFIDPYNTNLFLPYHFDIHGNLLIKNHKTPNKIINIITSDNKKHSWKNYLILFTSFLRNDENYCINPSVFLQYLHYYNFIDSLHIKSIDFYNKKNKITNSILVKYTKYPLYKIIENNNIFSKSSGKNHFFLNSFNILKNKSYLKNELMRLFINRDKYKSIHFHLDDNRGGDLIPVHLIIRCLVGQRESWMKNVEKRLSNGKIMKWDPWKEDQVDNPNYKRFTELDLDFVPDYKDKYKGKIYLYMHNYNGSSSWYFITYLIYAFSNKIKRFNKKCFGKVLKFGKLIGKNQLKLKGISSTCSGDGNSKIIDFKEIKISCPTIQIIHSSVKDNDWNRFWIE